MALTRDSFLNFDAGSLKPEKVEVPILGGCCYVRRLSAGERDALENRIQRRKGRNARAEIVAAVAVDENGKRLFGSSDVEDLAKLPVSALEPIVNAHLEVNAMSADDLADLEGN
ncbi:hypothetical protein [Paludisphaera sp.]|uniref:hypothetical protein n=1 Tax=Paludisphaera sp. TaxID=2017432 RepID=UPI00301E06A1